MLQTHIHGYEPPECLNESLATVLLESETGVLHLLVGTLTFFCVVVLKAYRQAGTRAGEKKEQHSFRYPLTDSALL